MKYRIIIFLNIKNNKNLLNFIILFIHYITFNTKLLNLTNKFFIFIIDYYLY
jgi:hypothetical protein